MKDSRLQQLEACLDDGRTICADLEEDGIPITPSIQQVRDRKELQAIHDGINQLIRRVQHLKETPA